MATPPLPLSGGYHWLTSAMCTLRLSLSKGGWAGKVASGTLRPRSAKKGVYSRVVASAAQGSQRRRSLLDVERQGIGGQGLGPIDLLDIAQIPQPLADELGFLGRVPTKVLRLVRRLGGRFHQSHWWQDR